MLQHQLIRYAIVGLLSVSVDFLLLNAAYLVLHLSLFWSVMFGFTISIILGYYLHSRWTFQYDTSKMELTKMGSYIFMTIVALGITEAIVYLGTEHFGLYYNFSKAIALVFAITFTYLSSKYWIFRKPVSFH